MRRRHFLTGLGLLALQPDAFAQRGDDRQEARRLTYALLARYARGVPAAEQTRLDRVIADALDEIPEARSELRTAFTPARIAKLPTSLPDRLKLTFPRNLPADDAPSPKLLVRKLPPPQRVRIHVAGFHCFSETSEATASDTIYALIATVTRQNGPPGKRWKVKPGMFPYDNRWVNDVDAGETVNGPRSLIYDGPAADTVLVNALMEHDWGAGKLTRLVTIVTALLATLQDNDPETTHDDVIAMLNYEMAQLKSSGLDYDDDLVNDDDLIQARVRGFTRAEMQAMALHPPHETESVGGMDFPAKMPYHFRTRHKGDGGHYLFYYRVEKS